MIGRWKIYYSDGREFSNEDGSARSAPFWDVQNIIQWNQIAEKKYHQNQADWYIFRDGFWFGVDRDGLIDYLAHYRDEYIIKMGRTIPTHKWLEIFNRAKRDDFIK